MFYRNPRSGFVFPQTAFIKRLCATKLIFDSAHKIRFLGTSLDPQLSSMVAAFVNIRL
jgi:hypothetical protein